MKASVGGISRGSRGLVAIVAVAVLFASSVGCVAKKNTSKPGITLSGPGPEILGGGLLVVGGAYIAYEVGTQKDQFNLQQTITALGVGVAILGAVLIGHGIYRLTRPAPAAPPPGALGLSGAPTSPTGLRSPFAPRPRAATLAFP